MFSSLSEVTAVLVCIILKCLCKSQISRHCLGDHIVTAEWNTSQQDLTFIVENPCQAAIPSPGRELLTLPLKSSSSECCCALCDVAPATPSDKDPGHIIRCDQENVKLCSLYHFSPESTGSCTALLLLLPSATTSKHLKPGPR